MKTTNNKSLTQTIKAQKASSSIKSSPVQSSRPDGITALYLGCKTNNTTGSPPPIWLPIYRFSWDDNGYFYYSYTKGFQDHYSRFIGHIINPDCGFHQTWITKRLDTRISTRIPRRADSLSNYNLLGIAGLKGDYIAYLARSGGRRVGDNYDIFPEVQRDEEGYYNFYFSVAGLGKEIEANWQWVEDIKETPHKLEHFVLKHEPERSLIFYRESIVGNAPEYIHHLIGSSIYHRHQIRQVNHTNYNGGGGVLVHLKLGFSSSPWQQRSFQPINPMAV